MDLGYVKEADGFRRFVERSTAGEADQLQVLYGVGGFLHRYPPGDDSLSGQEGVFLPCLFWLVNCLAHQGRLGEAHETFERALSTANDLLLFSEEYDPATGQMLGNFPQILTHLSLITAAVALVRPRRRAHSIRLLLHHLMNFDEQLRQSTVGCHAYAS